MALDTPKDPFIMEIVIRAPVSLKALIMGWLTRERLREMLMVLERTKADSLGKQWRIRQSVWAPLNPAYLHWKAQRGFFTDIWKRSGAVFTAVTTPGANADKALKFSESTHRTKMRVVPGKRINYWAYVHYGVEPHLTPRPWLHIDPSDRKPMQEALDTYMRRHANKEMKRALVGARLITAQVIRTGGT